MPVVVFSTNQDPFTAVQRELDELRTKYLELLRAHARLKSQTDNRKKLTIAEVSRIRRFAAEGKSQRWIADRFDINRATVSRIVRNLYHAA
ncbi:helix-turn-helix domain-containing protein [Actinokineospora enzanensis]|uniref:helix-turn-helix domain-containing protein n=1 Tax=Actinokineospora enzanensis TaxID=155975 RepID=UPI00037044FF|nr:helix-turn-helix domain-containing protein [Actinokineospora enzanensis]